MCSASRATCSAICASAAPSSIRPSLSPPIVCTPIRPSTAGDHEIGFGQCRIETRALEHPLRTLRHLRLREERESCRQSTRGPTHGRRSELRPPGLRPELRQPGEARSELRNFLGSRTFLWSKDGRGAVGSEERRGDVGQCNDARRDSPPRAERRECHQCPAAVGKWLTRRILERPAEPARRSGASVHGCRAAEADNDCLGAAIRGGPDEFADASCGRSHRIAVFGLDQGETAGGRAFDDGRFAVDPAHLRRHRIADGARDLQPFAQRAGRQHDVEQPIAAVGDWALEHRGARHGAAYTRRDCLSDLAWTECALEGCGSDEDDRRHGGKIVETRNPLSFPRG